jgi:hypothetical protein
MARANLGCAGVKGDDGEPDDPQDQAAEKHERVRDRSP